LGEEPLAVWAAKQIVGGNEFLQHTQPHLDKALMVEPMAAHSDPTPEAIEGVPSGDWQETLLAHQTMLTSMTRHFFPCKVLTIDYLSAIWARWLLRWYLLLEYV
jgi:hypothetical protein